MSEELGQRVLRVSRDQVAEMRRAVIAAAPQEACGLLLGTGDRALEVVAMENVLHSPTRFRLEPAAQVRALLGAEAKGWQLLAVFHSHPAGPAHPSASDLAEAAYPEALSLIWAPGSASEWECRAFELRGDERRLGAGSFIPARLVREE